MNAFKNIIHRIKPKKSRTIPCYDMKIAFLNTVEGCCLFAASRESIYAGVKAVFYTLSPEVQYMLIFSPKAGEWAARATVEGCCLFAASRESIYAGVKAVFYTLSPEVQYMLIFSPKAGEWAARA